MKRRSKPAPAPVSVSRGAMSRAKAAGILVLALAAAWFSSFPGSGQCPTRVWRGYETLLVRPQTVRDGGLARLLKDLGPGVVCPLNAPVSFWNFTGVETAPLGTIDDRIDPRDPRHDRVMDELMGYFRAPAGHGSSWTVVFLPARNAPLVDFLRVASAFGFPHAGSWRLVEFDPLEAVAGVAGLLGFALLLARAEGRGGRGTRFAVTGAGAAFWIPFILGGGTARLALALAMLFTWYRAADVFIVLRGWDERLLREARGPLVVFLAAAGAGMLLLVPAGGFSAGALVAFAGPVSASVLLMTALALYWGRAKRPRRSSRKKFEPVPIVKPAAAGGPPQAGVVVALAALTALAVIPLVQTVPVPTPMALLGVRDFSWGSLESLGRSSRVSRLPDMSDLVTHEAFQETIAFGRPWGLPRPDERVYVRGFLIGQGGGITAVQRRVKVFDSVWLAACLRRAAPGSVEQLLVAQGRAVAVALRGSARPLARELAAAVLIVAVFFAWLARAPEARRGSRIRAPLMKSVLPRLNGAARRNQIP
jgi:hypothetical protein